jgi:lysophospholipase L1-like esterase
MAALLFSEKAFAQEIDLPDTSKYKWYQPQMNYIQFHNRSAINHFYNTWKAGKATRMNIVHAGDSHIQSDISTSTIRKNFQLLRGDGGRGMMFPYSTAKSYSSIKYACTHSGEWEFGKTMIIPPKQPIGVAGMSSRTRDSTASFRFTWNEPVPENYTELRIFCDRSDSSYHLMLETADGSYPIAITAPAPGDSLPYVSVTIKKPGPYQEFKVKRTAPGQNHFMCYGVELTSSKPGGLVYHAVGVGGSRFRGILHSEKFVEQLSALKPDLVILDFGTNDFLYDDSIKTELPDEIRHIVAKVRAAAPNTGILLTTTQDLYYKRRNVRAGQRFSQLISQLALELDCMHWDWFWVSGGRAVLKDWAAQGLAQKDLIHLTGPGYRLKGRLLSEAFLATIDSLDRNPQLDSLVLDTTPLAMAQAERLKKVAQTDPSVPTGNYITYRIKSGDTLGHIAQRHGVTVRQLQQWNNLRGTMIIAGKTLIIYR